MSAESSAIKRPIVVASDRGLAAKESADFYSPMVSRDVTFVPGYSDKRRLRDEQRRRGEKAEPLAFRLQFVRTRTRSGQADITKVASWSAKGYRRVKGSELDSLGLSLPIGGHVNDQDNVVVGDVELFMCDAKRAAHNERARRSAVEAQTEANAGLAQLEADTRPFAKPGEELTWATTERRTEITPR